LKSRALKKQKHFLQRLHEDVVIIILMNHKITCYMLKAQTSF